MSKKNTSKLKSREFSKTFKQCVFQLKKMKEEQLTPTNSISITSGLIESSSTTKSPSSEIKNVWGQKDLNSILKEKNERIYSLERDLEEKKNSFLKLEQEKKKMKFEYEKEKMNEDFQNIIKEKDKLIAELLMEQDINKKKISNLESQLQLEKSSLETLKESNKCLVEISNRKPQPIHKRDHMLNLKKFLENEAEISRLQIINSSQEKELLTLNSVQSEYKTLIECLQNSISDLENRLKFKTFSKDIQMNDIESVLMDEIDNITTAYDKIKITNAKFEKELLISVNKISELMNENLTFKNKISIYEDSKIFLEKERKRLDEWKSTLAEETKIFQEKFTEIEALISDKDRKISDYKLLLTNLQANHKILQDELNNSNSNYRIIKREFESLKLDFLALKTEHESNKKLCDILRGLNSSDAEIIEDLERHKKVIRCSLCDTNIKNCVLVKCSHTFCDNCIENRLKARQRKCPTCQAEFNNNDIKKIYL